MNFDDPYLATDYIFLSNLRRQEELGPGREHRLIATSNLPDRGAKYRVDYRRLLNHLEPVWDNAGLMLVKLLIQLGVKELYLAGVDGYSHDPGENYAQDAPAPGGQVPDAGRHEPGHVPGTGAVRPAGYHPLFDKAPVRASARRVRGFVKKASFRPGAAMPPACFSGAAKGADDGRFRKIDKGRAFFLERKNSPLRENLYSPISEKRQSPVGFSTAPQTRWERSRIPNIFRRIFNRQFSSGYCTIYPQIVVCTCA